MQHACSNAAAASVNTVADQVLTTLSAARLCRACVLQLSPIFGKSPTFAARTPDAARLPTTLLTLGLLPGLGAPRPGNLATWQRLGLMRLEPAVASLTATISSKHGRPSCCRQVYQDLATWECTARA
jgi:hypothetical protein